MHLDSALDVTTLLLRGDTLRLLARDLGARATSTGTGSLVLLSHLGLGLLLLLALGKSLLAGSSSHLGLLVSAGGDGLERGTDDSSLVLNSLARALLGNLLGDTLLVHATVEDGPGKLTGVLALEEERLALARVEAEDL